MEGKKNPKTEGFYVMLVYMNWNFTQNVPKLLTLGKLD